MKSQHRRVFYWRTHPGWIVLAGLVCMELVGAAVILFGALGQMIARRHGWL